jgi:CheY-like chemotaxis protein
MNKKRIMIVEDEAIVAADLQSQLTSLGYEITGLTRTGEESIGGALQWKPDLVLMDVHLAGKMDGTEAAAQIRAQIKVPIIFLTAFIDSASLERAKASEPYGYLVKPFDARELRATIEMALFKDGAEKERQKLMAELQEALANVKMLSGLLPICCACKKIRDDKGYWNQLEVFLDQHSDAKFTHSFCPDCMKKAMKQALISPPLA